MKEHVVPSRAAAPADLNITDLLERQVARDPDNSLFARQLTPGEWTEISARAFRDDVAALAAGLIARGVEPGDSVAIMSSTRYEWTLLDFAIWYAGAVTVPIYETSSPAQVAWIVQDAAVSLVLVEGETHAGVVDRAVEQEKLTGVREVLSIDAGDLEALRADGQSITADVVEERRSRAGLADTATLIYTSGTTGRPKGCMLSHGNFAELSLEAMHRLGDVINPEKSTVMFIPLAHVFARFISVLAVASGATVGHTADIKQLVEDLGTFRPTFLLAVPRLFEKIYNGALTKAQDEGKGEIFEKAAQTAVDWSRARQAGRVPLALTVKHRLFSALVYSKLRRRMGGRVTHAVSGGSPLGERLGHFFHGIGLSIMEGYGLTETTAPLTVNVPDDLRIGTVGPPLPGCGVRIADDGEVLGRGVCVFHGYHGRPDLDAEAFTDDGWFRTGDLGHLDEHGCLVITGRKKEILVTAGGKNVSPAPLEDALRSDALISQAVVVGDARPFVAALLTLDEEALPGFLERHGLDPQIPAAEAAGLDTVRQAAQDAVDRANEGVSKAESIRAFRVLGQDFTVETGHLTLSMKLRRPVVMEDCAEEIEALYAEAKQNRDAGPAPEGSAG